MKIILVTIFAVLTLPGCTAVKNIAEDYKYTSSLRHFVSDESKQARYQELCTEVGLTPEGEGWANCLIKARELDLQRASARSARAASSSTNTTQSVYRNNGCAATNSCF